MPSRNAAVCLTIAMVSCAGAPEDSTVTEPGVGLPMEQTCTFGPVPAGCWLATPQGPCEWSDVPLDCAAALLVYGATVGPDVVTVEPLAAQQRAAEYCSIYCAMGSNPLQGEQTIGGAAACIDGTALGPVIISTFPCSVCSAIGLHAVAGPETCGLDDACGSGVCGDGACDVDCGESAASCPGDCGAGPP